MLYSGSLCAPLADSESGEELRNWKDLCRIRGWIVTGTLLIFCVPLFHVPWNGSVGLVVPMSSRDIYGKRHVKCHISRARTARNGPRI